MDPGRMDGQLEFYDTSELTLLTNAEHTQATDLEWDPSGRYIVTSVSYWTQKVTHNVYSDLHIHCFSMQASCLRIVIV